MMTDFRTEIDSPICSLEGKGGKLFVGEKVEGAERAPDPRLRGWGRRSPPEQSLAAEREPLLQQNLSSRKNRAWSQRFKSNEGLRLQDTSSSNG
jgi:hypothetical protein